MKQLQRDFHMNTSSFYKENQTFKEEAEHESFKAAMKIKNEGPLYLNFSPPVAQFIVDFQRKNSENT